MLRGNALGEGHGDVSVVLLPTMRGTMIAECFSKPDTMIENGAQRCWV